MQGRKEDEGRTLRKGKKEGQEGGGRKEEEGRKRKEGR